MADGSDSAYDYVVIGGGSAGCVLAARLSERSANNVLLLEAGDDYAPGTEPAEILDSFAATAHANPRFIWAGLNAAFLPRPGNAPDRRPRRKYTQGRVIGGGSSVNGMVANRGLPSDYADWVARGALGWAWEDVLPFFRKLESDQDFDGPLHGKDGPIALRRIPYERWPAFTRATYVAVEEAGYRNLEDQNAAFEEGYCPIAINNMNDERISTARAYLTKEVRARSNLTILGNSMVEQLLYDGTRVTGVRVRRNGALVNVHGRETIISTGALHSPAILMRSGIGPAAELTALGIKVVVDRPGVGKHLMEHPGVNLGLYLKRGCRLPSDLRRQMFAGLRFSSGFEGCPPADMYIIPSDKASWHAVGSRMGLLMMWVNKSYSTGEVRLVSPDPMVEPSVDYDMCSDPRDMERLVIGTRMMLRLQAHPAVQAVAEEIFPVSFNDRARKLAVYGTWNKLQTWIGAQVMDSSSLARKLIVRTMIADGPTVDDLTRDESAMREWIRDTVLGHWHASCTCRMGAADDPGAVTDSHARVYGVSGLRVCDASIFPAVPCANTNIPTIMTGEKVAATILAE